MNYLALVIWNIFVLAGAVYLIQSYDWSLWTILLAIILLHYPEK